MERRDFLKFLLGTAAAATVDFEQLLWVPKPIVIVPSIDVATYEFWRNQHLSDDHAFDALRYSMREVYNHCTLGGADPPLWALIPKDDGDGES